MKHISATFRGVAHSRVSSVCSEDITLTYSPQPNLQTNLHFAFVPQCDRVNRFKSCGTDKTEPLCGRCRDLPVQSQQHGHCLSAAVSCFYQVRPQITFCSHWITCGHLPHSLWRLQTSLCTHLSFTEDKPVVIWLFSLHHQWTSCSWKTKHCHYNQQEPWGQRESRPVVQASGNRHYLLVLFLLRISAGALFLSRDPVDRQTGVPIVSDCVCLDAAGWRGKAQGTAECQVSLPLAGEPRDAACQQQTQSPQSLHQGRIKILTYVISESESAGVTRREKINSRFTQNVCHTNFKILLQ